MMILTEEQRQRISSSPSDSRGVKCQYYSLGDNRGLKSYKQSEHATDTRVMQMTAAGVEAAPSIYSEVFEITAANGKIRHAYITEEVSILGDMFWTTCGSKAWCTQTHKCGGCWEKTAEEATIAGYEEDFEPVYSRLKAAGFRLYDLHIFNIGYSSNGKPVVIDFDHCAMK